MHAYTVGVVHLADIKFGNLEQTQSSEIVEHLVWLNNQGLPNILPQYPLKYGIGSDFSLAIEEKFSRSPN